MTLSQDLIAEYRSMYPNDGITLWKQYVKQDFGDLRKPENKAKALQWLQDIKPIDSDKSVCADTTPAKLPYCDPITGMPINDDVETPDTPDISERTPLTKKILTLQEIGVTEALQIDVSSAPLQELRDYLDTIASTCKVNADVEITLYYPRNKECFAVIGDTEGNEQGRVYGFTAEELFTIVSESDEDNSLDFLAEYV